MTPTNTPRDEALNALNEIESYFDFIDDKNLGIQVATIRAALSQPAPIDDTSIVSGASGICINSDALRVAKSVTQKENSALATDAPIEEKECTCQKYAYPFDVKCGWCIEGLDEAISNCIKAKTINDLSPDDVIALRRAAQAYAQGRTQAVPDGWKMICEQVITNEMQEAGAAKIAELDKLKASYGVMADLCFDAMLSAAPTPPVTGSAWQPIETAPKDGTKFDVLQTSGDRLINCQWCNKLNTIVLRHGYPALTTIIQALYWMPEPTPPRADKAVE